jgi:hypothetical protein
MGKLPPETKQAVRQHRNAMVSADVAADVTRAGGLSYSWWLGVPSSTEGWELPAYFVAYVDEIAAEES